jgi:hypothetical protein
MYRDGGTCWGITDSATQFQLSLFAFRLHRRYYTTAELELSNSQTLEPSTLDLSNCRLSNPGTIDSRSLEVFSRNLTLEVSFSPSLEAFARSRSQTLAPTFQTLELSSLR